MDHQDTFTESKSRDDWDVRMSLRQDMGARCLDTLESPRMVLVVVSVIWAVVSAVDSAIPME